MERFNYPSLKAVRRESAELLQLIEAESYGYKRDEKEKLDRLEAEAEHTQALSEVEAADYGE